MNCDCDIEPTDKAQERVLIVVLTVNGVMFLAEMIVGLLANSSGVIADSMDMLADALVCPVIAKGSNPLDDFLNNLGPILVLKTDTKTDTKWLRTAVPE